MKLLNSVMFVGVANSAMAFTLLGSASVPLADKTYPANFTEG